MAKLFEKIDDNPGSYFGMLVEGYEDLAYDDEVSGFKPKKRTWADEKYDELMNKGKDNWDQDDWDSYNYIMQVWGESGEFDESLNEDSEYKTLAKLSNGLEVISYPYGYAVSDGYAADRFVVRDGKYIFDDGRFSLSNKDKEKILSLIKKGVVKESLKEDKFVSRDKVNANGLNEMYGYDELSFRKDENEVNKIFNDYYNIIVESILEGTENREWNGNYYIDYGKIGDEYLWEFSMGPVPNHVNPDYVKQAAVEENGFETNHGSILVDEEDNEYVQWHIHLYRKKGYLKEDKFVPQDKMSKKAQKELNDKKRNTWGNTNPVTRVQPNKKAYDRKRDKKELDEELTEDSEIFKDMSNALDDIEYLCKDTYNWETSDWNNKENIKRTAERIIESAQVLLDSIKKY